MTYEIEISIPGQQIKVLPFNYEEPAVKEFENLRKNNTVVDPGQIESKYAGTIKLLELDGKERWEKDSFTISNNIL